MLSMTSLTNASVASGKTTHLMLTVPSQQYVPALANAVETGLCKTCHKEIFAPTLCYLV